MDDGSAAAVVGATDDGVPLITQNPLSSSTPVLKPEARPRPGMMQDFEAVSILSDRDGGEDASSSSAGAFIATFEINAAPPLDACFRKVTCALLPIFFLLNCLNYLDRTNLAFAAIQMSSDLDMTQQQYGAGSSIFFLGYCLCQIPSQMILRRVGAPLWLGVIVTTWGAVALSMAGITGVTYFYVARLLLGIAEAGSFPASWTYVSGFYPDSRVTAPYAIMDAAIMVAQVIGAPIAAGFLRLNGLGGLAGWQWLFLLEGLPTLLLGVSLFFLLPASPRNARFLTRAEGEAVQAAVDECRGPEDVTRTNMELLWAAATNARLLHISAVKFLKDVTSYGTMYWTPVMIRAMLDYHDSGSNACQSWSQSEADETGEELPPINYSAILLTGIPFTLAATSCILLAKHSQVTRERVWHIGVPYIIAGVTFLLLPVLISAHVVLGFIGLTVVITCALCPNGVLVSLASAVSAGPGLAINLGLYNSIANAGGVVGPYVVGLVGGKTCSYSIAFWLLGALLVVGGVGILFVKDPSAEKARVTGAGALLTDSLEHGVPGVFVPINATDSKLQLDAS